MAAGNCTISFLDTSKSVILDMYSIIIGNDENWFCEISILVSEGSSPVVLKVEISVSGRCVSALFERFRVVSVLKV